MCQPSLGFDGPGGATLASCGGPLYGQSGGHVASWQLSGVPPWAESWLVVGEYEPAWVPSLGAFLVSPRPDYVLSYYASAAGTFAGQLWTPATSTERHYQVVSRDPTQPRGVTVSNAVRMDFLPTYMRAVRGVRYKLIRLDPCREELYDLDADPFERTNLLARPLSAEELGAYQQLATRLDSLHR